MSALEKSEDGGSGFVFNYSSPWAEVVLKKVRMAGVVASKVRKQRAKERPSLKEAKEEEKRPIKVFSNFDSSEILVKCIIYKLDPLKKSSLK